MTTLVVSLPREEKKRLKSLLHKKEMADGQV
jgi:hypothetical protein